MEAIRKYGLRELPPDSRDFVLGAAYPLPPLSELPAEFVLEPLSVKNQRDSDFCTAFATCGASELQEGVELEPSYTFAISKEFSGDPEQWGQDLRTAAKTHVKVGALEKTESPYSLDSRTASFLRVPQNWDQNLKSKALLHAKNSYMAVSGPYDPFDDIRASMWLFREQKRGVVLGVLWNYPVSEPEINEPAESGEGHAIYALGWVTRHGEPYLVIQNSYGTEVGDKGRFYLSRKVVNKFAPLYGSYMFVDMTRAEYLERVKPQIQLSLIEILKNLVLALKAYLEKPSAPEPKEVKPEPEKPRPETMPEMVKRVCIEEKLSPQMAEQVYRTIQCESNFNPKAINRNNPGGTVDYGICQYNSRWYIGPGKPIPSVDVALNDPEFCVRVMCKQFKKGRAKDWICYRKLFS